MLKNTFRAIPFPKATLLPSALAVSAVLAAGCDTETDVTTTPVATTPVATTPGETDFTAAPTPIEPTGSPLPDDLTQSPVQTPPQSDLPRPVEMAREDLAQQLDTPADSIEVLEIEQVVWPDTCLGLPAPELCAPGETPGYRVTLVALGQEYIYHTDKGETFRFAGPGDASQRP